MSASGASLVAEALVFGHWAISISGCRFSELQGSGSLT